MDSTTIILTVAALVTSTLSGTIGMGGGIVLLAVMAEFLGPLVLIPVHGIIQLASNTSRTVILFNHIKWSIAGWFALGALIGAAVGSQLLIELPESLFKIGIGIFILVVTFAPKPKNAPVFKGKWAVLGGAAGFLGLFIGATGPLIAPFYLREGLGKEALVATKAVCQTFVHFFKTGTYLALGFLLAPYSKLLIIMIVAVFVGNYLGKHLLKRLPEKAFYHIFRVLIVVLATRLIWKGIAG